MDKRLKKLKIVLPKSWIDISNENIEGPPTFINEKLDEPGVLQISIAEYLSGGKPTAEYDDLKQVSKNVGFKNDFGELIANRTGDCEFGKYGFAQFSHSEFPFIGVWHLSNGKDFIFSTFICSKLPKQNEIDEVWGIVTSIKRKSFLF